MKTKTVKSVGVEVPVSRRAKSAEFGKDSVFKPIVIGKSKTSALENWETKDFKDAKYNPRYISDKRLSHLGKSIEAFGDLSGVVFNARSRTLVAGHQRLKVIGKSKTSVVTKAFTDNHGTIEEGHIVVHTTNGRIRIPLRIVDWPDVKVEKAANIAANSHGGEFDKEKLRAVLISLETKTFDIELLGLDPVTTMTLSKPMGETQAEKDAVKYGAAFKEYGATSFHLQHRCPRCDYQFDKGKPALPEKKDEKKVVKKSKTKKVAK